MNEARDERELAEGARSTLRVLSRRTPTTTGWRSPDTVRRSVVVRRRWRWSAGAGAVLLAAALTAVSLTTGGSGGGQVRSPHRVDGAVQLVANTSPVTGVDPALVGTVAKAEQALGVALLRQLDGSRNVATSPASLYVALGMLQNAARGRTAAQISQALQAGGLTAGQQNAGLAGLVAQLDAAAAKDGIALDSANSLWQQRGFDVRNRFLQTLAAYYRAGVWQVDYRKDMPGALKALNDWTSRQTHGRIPKLFDQLDPQTVLVLANAIYFRAAWATPFDGHATVPGTFTRSDGTPVEVRMMSGGAGLKAAIGNGYQAAELPYKGGRFAALAIMPTGRSLSSYLHGLTPDAISSIAATVHSGLEVQLPRFTTASTIDLRPVLTALGMGDAFTDKADFSGLSTQPTKLGQAIQRVYLGVGEKGTTATAVSAVSILPTAVAAQQVAFDHPFLFLVRDTQTGAVLFASEVQDPSAG